MATNYYKNTTSNDNSTATDIESLYATARVSIADANMKEKYYDSSTLTDVATKFAIPPAGFNLDKMTPPDTYYRNISSYYYYLCSLKLKYTFNFFCFYYFYSIYGFSLYFIEV